MKKFIIMVCLVLLMMVMLSTTAFAYIDPAAGSYIVQIIAGVVIALGITIGLFFKKIRLFFRNLKLKSIENKLNKQSEKKNS